MNTTTTYHEEIVSLLATDIDLRYFDASVDNLTMARTAGEMIRRVNARQARAEAMPTTAASAVRMAIELAMPNMDQRDLLYTLQALRLCPQR